MGADFRQPGVAPTILLFPAISYVIETIIASDTGVAAGLGPWTRGNE